MGERTFAKIKDLLLSMKELREQMGVLEDANGQLRNSNGQLVEGLNAAQIQMGVWVDEQGKAKDSLGRLVDGLSDVQISLKEYVDQNGKLRNSQDQIIDGLSAQQKAAGVYRNELGDLMNAQGEVIRLSAEHAAQMRANEMALVAQDRALGSLRKQLTSSASAIAMVTSNLMRMSGKTGSSAEMMTRLTTAVSVGVTAFNAGASAAKLLGTAKDLLKGKTLAQFVAQMSLNGATGNFAALAAGSAAAIFAGGLVMAMTNTGDAAQAAAGKVSELSDASKRLLGMKDNSDLRSQTERMLDGIKQYKAFVQDQERIKWLAKFSFQKGIAEEINKKFADADPLEFEKIFRGIVNAKITPLQKMQEQLTVIDAAIKVGLDKTGNAIKAREILQQDIIKEQNRAVLEANRDAEAALKAARDSLVTYPDALEKLKEGILDLGELRDAVTGDFIYSNQELIKAQEDAAKQLRDKFIGPNLAFLKDALDAGKSIMDHENDLRQEMTDRLAAFSDCFQQGIITQEEFNAAQDGLKKKLEENLEKLQQTP
ncbi:MAG: hypothetical protein FWC43_04725, partial [Planctomycetaceae bacterium]|nr:hypothetical protein [Planctomycetaceae bacterium]